MICWDGRQMHEAVQQWMEVRRETVRSWERCVGCDEARATDNGWCSDCWAEIEPS